MTKEELILLLKEYKENSTKLNMRLKELKNKRYKLNNESETYTSTTAVLGINQDIHSKNKIGDKVYKRIEQNESAEKELIKEIRELEEEIKELRTKVEAVSDRLEALKYKEKKILIAYYIDGRDYEDIGNNYYWELFKQTRSGETIKKIVEKAMQKMLKL